MVQPVPIPPQGSRPDIEAIRDDVPLLDTSSIESMVEMVNHCTDGLGPRAAYNKLSKLAYQAIVYADAYSWLAYLAINRIRELRLWRNCGSQKYRSFASWLRDWCADHGISRRTVYMRLTIIRVAAKLSIPEEKLFGIEPTKVQALIDRLNYDPRTGDVMEPGPGQLTAAEAVELLDASNSYSPGQFKRYLSERLGEPADPYFTYEAIEDHGDEVRLIGLVWWDSEGLPWRLADAIGPIPRSKLPSLAKSLRVEINEEGDSLS